MWYFIETLFVFSNAINSQSSIIDIQRSHLKHIETYINSWSIRKKNTWQKSENLKQLGEISGKLEIIVLVQGDWRI